MARAYETQSTRRAFGGVGQRTRRRAPVGAGEHPHGLARKPLQSGSHQPVLGVLGCARRDEHQRVLARRGLDLAERLFPEEWPGDPHRGRPGPWILELRERRDQRQPAGDAAVHVRQRRQADSRSGTVQLVAALRLAPHQKRSRQPPEALAGPCARIDRADRVDRETGLARGQHVWYERRPRPLLELRRESGTHGEDVRYHHRGIELAYQRARLGGRSDGRLVRPQRAVPCGEHLVFRRGGEADALALDVRAPLPPGLEGDVVPAARQLGAERDCGEGMAGVAERGQQDAARARLLGQSISASSRTMRLRASGSNAMGETIRVPTPASL